MRQTIYLAGGFKTDWAERVKERVLGFEYINPKQKEYKNGERIVMNVNEYGAWDLHFVKQSDIVFVYIERTNPSCVGTSVEAGYAKGLGKTVILVLEKNHEHIEDRYLEFLTQVADITFNDLESGIQYLKSFKI